MAKTVSKSTNDRNRFQDQNMTWHTYAQVRKAMNDEPFTMSLVGEAAEAVIKAVNIGIDSHLEACFLPDLGDVFAHGSRKTPEGKVHTVTLECKVSPESMPVLLRRLFESGEESAIFFASDILDCIYDEDEEDCND